jgi:hypothetical protein
MSNEAIMEVATSSGLFTSPEMRELNRCRLFLQVLFVSDVVDVAGVHVEAWDTKGRISDTRTRKWEWSVQNRPVKWASWKMLLDYISPDGVLKQPLGNWVRHRAINCITGTWTVMPT